MILLDSKTVMHWIFVYLTGKILELLITFFCFFGGDVNCSKNKLHTLTIALMLFIDNVDYIGTYSSIYVLMK